MKIAVFTGASSGLGREFFLSAAEQFPQVEEFWLIARREEKLKEMCIRDRHRAALQWMNLPSRGKASRRKNESEI